MRVRRAFVVLLSIVVLLTGCSGDPGEPSAEDLVRQDLVAQRAVSGGVVLSESARPCVVDSLGDDGVTAVEAAGEVLESETARELADAIIDCLGSGEIARASLANQAEGASEESLDCTADTFDPELANNLLASALQGGGGNSVEVEIEVAAVLAQCLTAEELLVVMS